MRLSTNFKLIISSVVVCLLLACNQQQANAEGKLYPLTIHAKSAQMFSVELANTPETMERGLMFRKELSADHGMLFVFPDTRPVTFWMKNTYIPLDMLFITEDGIVADIYENARPMDETLIKSARSVKAVLEISAGQVDKRGIAIGDHIQTELMK